MVLLLILFSASRFSQLVWFRKDHHLGHNQNTSGQQKRAIVTPQSGFLSFLRRDGGCLISKFFQATFAHYFMLNGFGSARKVILIPGTENHKQGFTALFKQNLRT